MPNPLSPKVTSNCSPSIRMKGEKKMDAGVSIRKECNRLAKCLLNPKTSKRILSPRGVTMLGYTRQLSTKFKLGKGARTKYKNQRMLIIKVCARNSEHETVLESCGSTFTCSCVHEFEKNASGLERCFGALSELHTNSYIHQNRALLEHLVSCINSFVPPPTRL